MQEPIEDGGCDDVVAKDASPVGDGLIRGQQDAAGLVTGSDQLKQQMGGLRRHRQVTELVDDEQLGARAACQASVPGTGLVGLLQLHHQGRRADEQYTAVPFNRSPAKTNG